MGDSLSLSFISIMDSFGKRIKRCQDPCLWYCHDHVIMLSPADNDKEDHRTGYVGVHNKPELLLKISAVRVISDDKEPFQARPNS